MNIENPEALNNVNAIEVTGDVRDFVKQLASDIEESKTERAQWENRLDDWFKKRFGIRNRKTHPWLDAANFVIPLIDADISRIKPSYVNLAYAVTPIVTFEPYGPDDVEAARKREWAFDWRMRTQVDFFDEYVVGVDKCLEKGIVVFKVDWDFETRTYTEVFDLDDLDPEAADVIHAGKITDDELAQVLEEEFMPDMDFQENEDAINKAVAKIHEGAQRVEITFIEKSRDRARVTACDPKDDIVVPIDTQDIQEARFIDHRYWMTRNQLKTAMRDGRFEEFPDHEIDAWSNKSPVLRWNVQRRDGISEYAGNELIYMHEVCTWYDVNGDGIDERVITTYPDAAPHCVLRFIENPFDHGMFPYVAVKRELVDKWFYSSRGIPAIDDDFQVGISTKFNQDIDNQTIVNTPTVVARRNSVKNLANLRYVPGQVVEVDDPTSYELRQAVNASQGTFLTSAQYLKAWANERLGNLTAGVSSVANMPGQGEGGKKTAREIDTITALSSQVQSLDLQVFQQQMAKVYQMIDALYEQFGNDEEDVIIGGKPVKISRKEIQCRAKIVPNGKLDNVNPQIRMNKTMLVAKLFMADPDIKQYELKKMIMDDIDVRVSMKVLMTPEEIQKRNAAQLQQQSQMQDMMLAKSLAMKSKVDAMDMRKEMIMKTADQAMGGQEQGAPASAQ